MVCQGWCGRVQRKEDQGIEPGFVDDQHVCTGRQTQVFSKHGAFLSSSSRARLVDDGGGGTGTGGHTGTGMKPLRLTAGNGGT